VRTNVQWFRGGLVFEAHNESKDEEEVCAVVHPKPCTLHLCAVVAAEVDVEARISQEGVQAQVPLVVEIHGGWLALGGAVAPHHPPVRHQHSLRPAKERNRSIPTLLPLLQSNASVKKIPC